MYRDKAERVILAVLMLFFLAQPVFATPLPGQTATTQTIDNTAFIQNQQQNTETTATTMSGGAGPGLEQALADAEMAVRQEQAERIKTELDKLGDELERLNTDYFAENAKLAAIEQSLNETRERLRWFEAELEAQRQVLNDRLSNIYKHGDVEPINAIINNTSFSELLTRLSMLMKISEQDVQLMDKLHDQKEKVESTKNSLDQLFAQQKEITAELEGRRKSIEAKMKEESDLLASIDTQTKQILQQDEQKQQAAQVSIVKTLTTTPQTAASKISVEPGTIAFEALKYLGVPYVWGGENPKVGLDCSGLVKVVFKKFGVDLPHYARAQAGLGAPVSYDELQPGDVVFFGHPIHHVGIYLGEGYFIHAPKRNDVVKISKLADRNDHAGARRIVSIVPSAQ
ncbi:MAG: C40 family peptidase [Candidatus Aquicultor sp.]